MHSLELDKKTGHSPHSHSLFDLFFRIIYDTF